MLITSFSENAGIITKPKLKKISKIQHSINKMYLKEEKKLKNMMSKRCLR